MPCAHRYNSRKHRHKHACTFKGLRIDSNACAVHCGAYMKCKMCIRTQTQWICMRVHVIVSAGPLCKVAEQKAKLHAR